VCQLDLGLIELHRTNQGREFITPAQVRTPPIVCPERCLSDRTRDSHGGGETWSEAQPNRPVRPSGARPYMSPGSTVRRLSTSIWLRKRPDDWCTISRLCSFLTASSSLLTCLDCTCASTRRADHWCSVRAGCQRPAPTVWTPLYESSSSGSAAHRRLERYSRISISRGIS
jgi:hypothetical protein